MPARSSQLKGQVSALVEQSYGAFEEFMRTWLRERVKERVVVRIAPAQGMEADVLLGEVDLATHQAMEPMLGDRKRPTKQMDIALLVAPAKEIHGAGQWRSQVECEASREAASRGRALAPGGCLGAVRGDITGRDALQGGHVAAMMALPDLGLPKRVESLDGVLDPVLFDEHQSKWLLDESRFDQPIQPTPACATQVAVAGKPRRRPGKSRLNPV